MGIRYNIIPGLGLLNYSAEGASFLFSLCLYIEKDGVGCHVSFFWMKSMFSCSKMLDSNC